MKVLVTGANGYIGSHVVETLLDHGFGVIGVDLDNFNIKDKRIIFKPINILEECDSDDLFDRLECPDICIHLAWRNGFEHNSLNHFNDLSAHFKFIYNLYSHGVKHFAIAGSFREYGNYEGQTFPDLYVKPQSLYSAAKLSLKKALEILFLNSDVCFQWFRPFTIYGDDEKNNSLFSKIIKWESEGKKDFPFVDGEQEYDFIEIHDLAFQIVSIISQVEIQGVIDCCSGVPVKIGDFINSFIEQRSLSIKPIYGAFQRRNYDTNVIYGNPEKINSIIRMVKK